MEDKVLDSFVSYRSYHESLKVLSIEQYGRLMFAINEYALYGKEPQFEDPMDKALWVAISTGVRHSREISITRSKASRLRKSFGGGAPINNNNASKPEQEEFKTTTKQQQNNNKAEQNNNEGRREKGEGRKEIVDSSQSSESSASDNADCLSFDIFWETYGNKKDKKHTLSAWNRLSKKDKQDALDGIPLYKKDCELCNRTMKYPATYLNGRTWEDDFKNEEEEKQEEDFPVGLKRDAWEHAKKWMADKLPRIHSKISPREFMKMKSIAHDKRDVFTEILIEIDKSDYTGNILKRFDKLSEDQRFVHRILKDE